MEIKSPLKQFEDTRVYKHYVGISKSQAFPYLSNGHSRVICTLNHIAQIRTSLMPFADGYFILMNKKIIQKLNLKLGDLVTLHIAIDHSEYGMDFPYELSEVFDNYEESFQHFQKLTPGKQRSLIYLVNQVKHTTSRLNKALAIAEHLLEFNGTLDFKELNQKIKEVNQRYKLRS